MPHLSKRRLDPRTKSLLSKFYTSTFSNIRKDEIEEITDVFLSPVESRMVEKRLAIIAFFIEGFSQEFISKFTKTTRQTVGRLILQWKQVPERPKRQIVKRLRSTLTGKLLEELTMVKTKPVSRVKKRTSRKKKNN